MEKEEHMKYESKSSTKRSTEIEKEDNSTPDTELFVVDEESETLEECWKKQTAAVMEVLAREESKEQEGWDEQKQQDQQWRSAERQRNRGKNIQKRPARRGEGKTCAKVKR
eukprot:15863325-Heterocapsa_arctica.AAC.1